MMNSKHMPVHEAGFTLLELLIAITILATGLLAVASMQGTAIGSNTIANRHTTLAALAQQTMEDLTARAPTNLMFQSSIANVVYDLDPASASTSLTIPGVGTYNATFSILRNPSIVAGGSAATVTGIVRIDVSVTDGTRTITLSDYKRTEP